MVDWQLALTLNEIIVGRYLTLKVKVLTDRQLALAVKVITVGR